MRAMDKKHGIASVEDRLARWKEMKAAAEEAYAQLQAIGHAAATPEYRELALRAKMLRERADREFAAITRAVRMDDDPQP